MMPQLSRSTSELQNIDLWSESKCSPSNKYSIQFDVPTCRVETANMRGKVTVTLLILALGFGFYGVYSGKIVVPDAWNPWAPLKIEEPLGWLTRFKLARLSANDDLCLATLALAEMRYTSVPNRKTTPGCGFDNAVTIERTSVRVNEPFTLSCRAAVSLALWERHVLHPEARKHLSEQIVRIEHFGSYACRNINGQEDAPLSRHATADAFDVASFRLASGRQIRIERDWPADTAEGQFLRAARDGACRVFDSVLGPEYNAAHRDHFHLERGNYRSCR